ncbi:hypothetical protein VQ03_11645 [Methylobacterium tarhaniae]|uniref:Uncharacterized protein n=1 Tax=Methylobacterium tarhaniae TaxID=1187852 RepID=A0A0J6T8E7_9HYPH|nr:hypothetical protein VQ03_11645 [Methylobacterium tarhaniae]
MRNSLASSDIGTGDPAAHLVGEGGGPARDSTHGAGEDQHLVGRARPIDAPDRDHGAVEQAAGEFRFGQAPAGERPDDLQAVGGRGGAAVIEGVAPAKAVEGPRRSSTKAISTATTSAERRAGPAS